MTSTPPPPSRLRTPPTPIHGPKYDRYEPYSPRRSSRLTKNRNALSPPVNGDEVTPASTPKPKARASHATRAARPSLHRTASQTHSPPPSPGRDFSEHLKSSPSKKAVRFGASVHADDDAMQLGSDDEGSSLRPGQQVQMMPTPRKTPKGKRAAHLRSVTDGAARALFAVRGNDMDDIMPSPRRSRVRKHNAFTLESFADDNMEEDGGIAIYTDSKERVPDADASSENPFLSRKSPRHTKQPKTKYGMTKEIDAAVDNNEGMVYVFRGKKFFRKFSDTTPLPSEAEPTDDSTSTSLQRAAGTTSTRPFRRSRIAPRKLFTEEIAQRSAEQADDPEEMTTDIEAPPAAADEQPAKSAVYAQVATPPSTARKDRVRHQLGLDVELEAGEVEEASPSTRRRSPFDAWARGKAGKRGGEPLHGEGKRTRSQAAS